MYRTKINAGEELRALPFGVPLRVYKNNIVKMKISYAAFLEEMDVLNYIRHKFWGRAFQKLEQIREQNLKSQEEEEEDEPKEEEWP